MKTLPRRQIRGFLPTLLRTEVKKLPTIITAEGRVGYINREMLQQQHQEIQKSKEIHAFQVAPSIT